MKNPIIGISCHLKLNEEDWFKNYQTNYVGRPEVESIIKANGTPIMLPMTNDINLIKNYLDIIDGLVIIGGEDINPSYYNEDLDKLSGVIVEERDKFEELLIKEAFNRKIPMLLICRGMQMINALYGGTLYQDLSLNKDYYLEHQAWNKSYRHVHQIAITKEDSFMFDIYKKNNFYVNSLHHQAIKNVSPLFDVTAISKDGVIEAIELKDKSFFCLAVQYHPEISSYYYDDYHKLMFNYFINYINNHQK
ncbi:MAG: gamma-glutamyl-gamma-aminobutyrate hydrolase family protein [Bacilli bacterium]|jgi:putative glutamine amidotransferase|nr:gamma-glutamyl-gamma-aminobutyrate hydrolase family protein [Bacilli bacterium]